MGHIYKDRSPKEVIFPVAAIIDELELKYNLTPTQVRFLSYRLMYGTDTECAKALGLAPVTIEGWKHNKLRYAKKKGGHVDFHSAYKELMAKCRQAAEGFMDSLASKVVKRVDELLDATRTIQIDGELVEVPDYESRFKGIQAASHWMDKWNSGGRVEIKNQYINMQEEFRQLMQRKLVEAQIIEGEVRELNAGNTPTPGDDV